MSLPLELFGKAVAIFTAGAGVAIPVAKTLSSGSTSSKKEERVKLEKEEDLKNNCLIVLQGGAQGQQDNQDKKLIVCQKNKKPETTEFYFYSQTKPFDTSSLKAVKSIRVTSENRDIIFTFERGGEETISISRGLWGDLNGLDLKNNTRVNFEEQRIYFQGSSGETYRALESLNN